MICVICGGTGGARLACGINYAYDPAALTYICNIGDNIRLHGLTICPDIDTVIYYLSGTADYDRGWGLHGESFNFLERSRLFYPDIWFGLGDKDYAGIENAKPEPGVLEAIASSSTVLIAPSNPLASILPIVSLAGVRDALVKNREKVWAISPVIEALELPEAERTRARSRSRLLAALGLPHTPASVGLLYREFCSHFVLDERDFKYASQLEEMGYQVHSLKTDALSLERQVGLARALLQLTEGINAAGF